MWVEMLHHTNLGSNEKIINLSYSCRILIVLSVYCHLKVSKHSNYLNYANTFQFQNTLPKSGGERGVSLNWALHSEGPRSLQEGVMEQKVAAGCLWELSFLLLKRDVWGDEPWRWTSGDRGREKLKRWIESWSLVSASPLYRIVNVLLVMLWWKRKYQFVVCYFWGVLFVVGFFIRVNEKPMNFIDKILPF